MRKTISAFMISLAALTISSPSNAWNLVCGVSINAADIDDERKWDADSHALMGISNYFAALAEFQRLSLSAEEVGSPESLVEPGVSSLDAGLKNLSESAQNFEKAYDLSEELNIGDTKGKELLHQLMKNISELGRIVAEENHLPTIDEMQSVVGVINEYTAYGMQLGREHLHIALPGHAPGGPQFSVTPSVSVEFPSRP